MGAFGYGPHEADGTETEMMDILTNSSSKNIKQKLLENLNLKNSYDFHGVRYVAYVIGKMSRAGLIKDKQLVKAAKTAYERILGNQDYLEDWKDTKELTKQLKKEYKMFLKGKRRGKN